MGQTEIRPFWSKIQAQLEAKIKTLEDAFDRDKENRQDYLEIQHRRKLKIKDQEISSLKEELKTNKEKIGLVWLVRVQSCAAIGR